MTQYRPVSEPQFVLPAGIHQANVTQLIKLQLLKQVGSSFLPSGPGVSAHMEIFPTNWLLGKRSFWSSMELFLVLNPEPSAARFSQGHRLL